MQTPKKLVSSFSQLSLWPMPRLVCHIQMHIAMCAAYVPVLCMTSLYVQIQMHIAIEAVYVRLLCQSIA